MRVEPFDTHRQMIFSRRAVVIGGSAIALFGGLAARLYHLQINKNEEFLTAADNNRFKQKLIVPLRGEIYDRHGLTIADNRPNFRVLLVPEDAEDPEQLIDVLRESLDIDEDQLARIHRNLKRNRQFTPIQVADNLSWDSFSALNYQIPSMPGLRTDVGVSRFYPTGSDVSFVLGYVGTANQRALDREEDRRNKLLLRQPGFKIGVQGLERTHEKELRGKAGTSQEQINAHGRVIDEVPNVNDFAVQGSNIGVTIDSNLQTHAMDVLSKAGRPTPEQIEAGAEDTLSSGAAVVMDIETGDVLVLASTPSFDPNMFTKGVSQETLNEMQNSKFKPFLNKAINAAFPPGSTFKMITALAAQEAGVSPTRRVGCSGKTWYVNRYFNCWKGSGHGSMDMRAAIKNSCDVYFWELAKTLDIDLIADMAVRFGLGQKYNLNIGTEQDGIVPSRAWKRSYYRSTPENQTWFQGETLSAAIGQGAVLSSPMQLAVMAARLASGKMVEPRLIRMQNNNIIRPRIFNDIQIDPEFLTPVREGMDAVVNQGGTAARSRLAEREWRMAGKTGTSQIGTLQRDPVTGRRLRNDELSWEDRDHALFVSYAPFDKPRYACAVLVEHGGSGSSAAGPVARDIMNEVMRQDPLKNRPFNPRLDKPKLIEDVLAERKAQQQALDIAASMQEGGE